MNVDVDDGGTCGDVNDDADFDDPETSPDFDS